MKFEPMLAGKVDFKKLKYPVLVSPKLDGIRALVQNGKLMTRSLKLVPNKQVQEKFAHLAEGLDGELVAGNPADKNAMQNTSTVVMSRDKDASTVKYYVFDIFNPDHGFQNRFREVIAKTIDDLDVVLLPQEMVANEADLLSVEERYLNEGYEGLMVRSINGPYKQGRCTTNEGTLLKLKRFLDGEAEIIGFEEEMENTNEAKTNALGRTERSSHKSGMVGKGRLGKFIVRAINGEWKGAEFGCGSGLNEVVGDPLNRDELWRQRKSLLGKIIKYKYFPIGCKDAPRLPILLGFRDKKDM